MNEAARWTERREGAVARGIGTLGVIAARAENAEVWDVDGRRYIDFAAGIAVLNTGHRHPKVIAAVRDQLDAFTHTCFHVAAYTPYIELAERLNALTPGSHAKKAALFTTGAEAVENAIKVARSYTGRSGVIAFSGGFHGRTMMSLALTGKVAPYKKGFGPFPAEIFHLPFPNAYHGISVADSLAALDRLFTASIESERVAAIIVEPVQGEGGFNIAPFDFLVTLRQVCDRYGIVLIADEVQTGIARTGRMFAVEHAGIVPDVMTLAKSLGGGFPLSAVVGRAEIMDSPGPGGLGGTYAGNPLACRAALAVLDVVVEENLIERARVIGAAIKGRLEAMAMQPRFACIGNVRGLGAMVAMEIVTDRATHAPAPDLTKAVATRCIGNGLIVLSCGLYGNVIRVLVPLTASDAIVGEGLDILEGSLAEVLAGEPRRSHRQAAE
jgi:4-aminobutyrate aminotransferase/(S)-3-amino-2-methylpropionate transaminase